MISQRRGFPLHVFAIHDALKASTVYILLLMENCSANGMYRNCPTERNACTCASTMTDILAGIHRWYRRNGYI